jgi:hypothetical protein
MTCPAPEKLAALADGEATHNEAAQLTQHVAHCAECRATQRRVLAAIDGLRQGSVVAERPGFVTEVMGRIEKGAAPRGCGVARYAMAMAALLVGFIAWTATRKGEEPPEFAARGGSSQAVERRLGFEVFRHAPTAEAIGANGGMKPGDGLSFVLYNRTGRETQFMLFAVDAKSDVHWFYPAYQSEAENPKSLPLPAAPQVLALREGVTPENPAPGEFKVVALFHEKPLEVRDVEASIERGGLDALTAEGATLQTLSLIINPR